MREIKPSLNLDSRDHLVAETVAWIHALILAWIKGRFGKEVMANNLDSCDLLLTERSFWPRPYLLIDWIGERGGWLERLLGKRFDKVPLGRKRSMCSLWATRLQENDCFLSVSWEMGRTSFPFCCCLCLSRAWCACTLGFRSDLYQNKEPIPDFILSPCFDCSGSSAGVVV